MISHLADINPHAYVDDTISVADGVVIRQFASVVRGAVLGRDCRIADTACVDGAVIGDRCIVGGGARLNPGLCAEDDVFFGPNCVVCNDVWPRAHKRGYKPRAFDGTRWAVIIEDGASIGANAVILPGVRIGAKAMIAAGSVVTRDVPAGHLWRRGVTEPIPGEPERMRFAE